MAFRGVNLYRSALIPFGSDGSFTSPSTVAPNSQSQRLHLYDSPSQNGPSLDVPNLIIAAAGAALIFWLVTRQ